MNDMIDISIHTFVLFVDIAVVIIVCYLLRCAYTVNALLRNI